VTSLVLLADADPNWHVGSLHERQQASTRTFDFTVAKLLDYAADTDALEASDNPVAWFTLAHVRTQQTHHDPDARYAAKLYMVRLLFRHGWSGRRIIVLFDAVNWMMVLPEPYERRFWRVIPRLKKEHEMKLLNPTQQLFFNDGIKKGLEQGRAEGAVALLERQLTQRFGSLPHTVRRKLAKASIEQIEAWSDALAAAQSLKQVFNSAS
jgi:hypothetical protein